jgi:hypothetical protein
MYDNAGTPPISPRHSRTAITLPLQATTNTVSCRSAHERGSRRVSSLQYVFFFSVLLILISNLWFLFYLGSIVVLNDEEG